jgi:hypothetical protein
MRGRGWLDVDLPRGIKSTTRNHGMSKPDLFPEMIVLVSFSYTTGDLADFWAAMVIRPSRQKPRILKEAS